MDPTPLLHAPHGLRFGDGVRQEPSIERRTFMALVSGGLLAAPLAAEGQQAKKVWRIGMLDSTPAAANAANISAFRQGMRELGYVEGQNFVIEYRSPEGRAER